MRFSLYVSSLSGKRPNHSFLYSLTLFFTLKHTKRETERDRKRGSLWVYYKGFASILKKKEMSNNNEAIHLTRQHRFKDTFALFIVFLSFNHFTSLCLLVIFIVATRIHNLMANSFVTLFLSKSPSPSIDEITHGETYTSHNGAFSLTQSAQSKFNHIYHSQPKKINRLPTNVNTNNSTTTTNNNNNNMNRPRYQDRKPQSQSKQQQQQLSPLSLLIEILIATIARLYAGNYFIIPIENLATSVLASSLINNPNECLSYATSCSVLYAISLNLLRGSASLSFLSNTSSVTGTIFYFLQHNTFNQSMSHRFDILPHWLFINSKYIRVIRYYLSFHIVVTQFSVKALNIQSSHDLASLGKNLSTNKGTIKNIIENEIKGSLPPLVPTPPIAISKRNLSGSSTSGLSPSNSNINVSIEAASSSNSNLSSPSPFTSTSNNSTPTPPNLSNSKEFNPYFTNIVKSIKSFAPTVAVPSSNELQSSNTTSSTINKNKTTDSNEPNQNFTNQLYELNVDLDSNNDVNSLKDDITVTTNLENFIRYLFKRNTQYIISPLWSIFVTLKTTTFEKRILNGSNYDNMKSDSTDNEEETTVSHTTESSENENLIAADPGTKSVFSNIDSDSMALIAQNKTDDYNQLNLITANNNIFNKKENDYKVCIIDIGTHTLTFHIENLTDGELIVLVNGLIWSEVSCALILEHAGEEYVVVSGLVPSCSYDIQFVNRLRHKDDYLICDLIVRTKSLDVDKYEVENNFGTSSNEFEKLDFSFPSYYHRKFLSPLLTLKHSILTTNANLIEERTKLKKTKKEVNKKLTTLRQEIDHLKTKIKQNETNDEKNSFKIENLKTTIQQNEAALELLEEKIKTLNDEEITLEDTYLKKKDSHLKKELEFSKLEEKYKKEHTTLVNKENKLKNDYKQSVTKREKMDTRHEKLQKEVTLNNELFEKYKVDFVAKKRKERTKRTENRIREINDLELSVKALEQDVNRLENENEKMKNMTAP